MISLPLGGESGLSTLGATEIAALLAAAADLVLILDGADVIETLSSNLERALEQHIAQWRGRPLRELIEPGSRAPLRNLLNAARGRRHGLRQVLRHPMADGDELAVAYVAQAVGGDGRVILLGRDQREHLQLQSRLLLDRAALARRPRAPASDERRHRPATHEPLPASPSLPTLETRLVALLEQMSDAVVLTDPQGVIAWCNDAFRRMVDPDAGNTLDGQVLADHLQCEPLALATVLGNLRRHAAGQALRGSVRGPRGQACEVSVTITSIATDARFGVGFVLRARSEASLMAQPDQELFRSADQLQALVGTVPLKGMVRDATDKVEKMCIEAALRLTGNNRALAAKVLGLSRQGLYQKLHQYQLADADDATDSLDED